MRYLELIVADVPDSGATTIRAEWVNPAHIETVEPYLEQHRDDQLIWLELILTSGRIRYIPLRPLEPGADLLAVARDALAELLAHDAPIHAVAID